MSLMNEEMKNHYGAVLHDLEIRRADIQAQVAHLQSNLRELNQTSENISRLLNDGQGGSGQLVLLQNPESVKYSRMSVRWAILCLLAERNHQFSVQEIADALKDGGIRTEAANFANNVAAVLSQMKMRLKPGPEVELNDGKWNISEVGRSAWNYIRSKQLGKRASYQRIPFSGTEVPDAATSGTTK